MPDAIFLSTNDAAKRLSLSPRTLESLRTKGGGPRFVRLGRRIAYPESELEAWAMRGLRSSTADTEPAEAA